MLARSGCTMSARTRVASLAVGLVLGVLVGLMILGAL